ncbi:MAG: phage minor head protein [Chitinophagales bacterium]
MAALFANLNAYYESQHSCGHDHHLPIINAIDISEWRKVYIELAKQSYEGKLNPEDLNEDLVRNTYQELNKGAASGYGKGWSTLSKNIPDKTALEIQKNLYRFSAAKSYVQAVDINNALVKDGKIQNYRDFEAEVLKLNNQYNLVYLQREYKSAIQGANMAKFWNQSQANKVYSNYKYKTQGDDRVRDEHDAVNNTIAPKNSPWWATWWPPNGYGPCRCYVEETNEEPTQTLPSAVPNTPKEFQFNVGISGQVFKENGKVQYPYFAIAKEQPFFEQKVKNMYGNYTTKVIREWGAKFLKGSELKHKKIADKVVINNADIRSITGKPHNEKAERNLLLYNLIDDFATSTFITQVLEKKDRKQYKSWYYLKSKSGEFYYNVVELKSGVFKLHAITDSIKNKKK